MQPVSWYLSRLRAMSSVEVAARGARHARFAAERLGLLRADRPSAATVWPPRSDSPLAAPKLGEARNYLAAAERIVKGSFEFFGECFELGEDIRWNVDPKTGVSAPLTFGKTLNYRDSRLVGDIKVLWELNRHLEAVTLAQAYALSGDRRYLVCLRRMISSWIRQCPYLRGANWCSALELGIRLVNWQLAYRLAGGAHSPLFEGDEGRELASEWLRSISMCSSSWVISLATRRPTIT